MKLYIVTKYQEYISQEAFYFTLDQQKAIQVAEAKAKEWNWTRKDPDFFYWTPELALGPLTGESMSIEIEDLDTDLLTAEQKEQ